MVVPVGFKTQYAGALLSDVIEVKGGSLLVRVYNYETGDYFEYTQDDISTEKLIEIYKNDQVSFPYFIVYYAVIKSEKEGEC